MDNAQVIKLAVDCEMLDPKDVAALNKIKEALYAISTSCDTGAGLGGYDLWPVIDGVEYFVTVTRSLKQKDADNKL